MFDEAWIVVACDQSRVATAKTGLDGACFGLVRLWAQRILAFPNETPLLRMANVRSREAEAVRIQRDYKAIKSATVRDAVRLNLTSQEACDDYGMQQGLAGGDLLLDVSAAERVTISKLRYEPQSAPGGYVANPRWFFDADSGDIASNTVYFWDVGLTAQTKGNPTGLHACASSHLTDMSGGGSFIFFDPNVGEMLIPCDEWAAFLTGWILRYTQSTPCVFISSIGLLPMRRAVPNPADIIPLVYAAWNAGFFRRKSAASTHAMARLRALAADAAQAVALREAIRWYAGRIAVDAGGLLAARHGAMPAATSKLRTLLNGRFASFAFF